MRISKFFYITLLMAIVIVPTSSNLHAQLTFYSSSSAFTVATGPGLTDLTFQPDLSLQPFLVVSSPLSSASSTTYQDVTGSIPNGITISDQANASNGLVVYDTGVGNFTFEDPIILTFSPDVNAVGETIFGTTSGPSIAGSLVEHVYDGSTLLGSKTIAESAFTYPYIGVTSTTPITSIQFDWLTNDGSTTFNNVSFGTFAVPEPSSWALLGSGVSILIFLRHRRRGIRN